MNNQWSRRSLLKQLAALSATLALPTEKFVGEPSNPAVGRDCEVQVATVSSHTVRLSVLPIQDGKVVEVPLNGALVRDSWGSPISSRHRGDREQTIQFGNLRVRASLDPLSFVISTAAGVEIQTLSVERATGVVSFATGESPLLGLGEGGPQFDRRGSVDTMISGQGGYHLETHGGRVPIPWIIGTAGWAMFFHQPFGTFDFTGPQSKFTPANPNTQSPLDIFFVASTNPATIMAEYARITGHAELPPLWSLGYQQSHRTLASRDEVLAEAKTFRDKKLPCDALIYLGTGFCSSGWNTFPVQLNQIGIEGVIAIDAILPQELELPVASVELEYLNLPEPLDTALQSWLSELGESAAETVLRQIEKEAVPRRMKVLPKPASEYLHLPNAGPGLEAR